MKFHRIYIVAVFCFLGWTNQVTSQTVRDRNSGAFVGNLTSFKHNVQGNVYAVDENTLNIENFHYDGAGPTDAYFWIGISGQEPNRLAKILNGMPVQNPSPSPSPSPWSRYTGQNILLQIPHGIKISKNLEWISFRSRSLSQDFGHIVIPKNLDVPQMRVLPGLSPLKHGVRSGNVTIVNSKTFDIPDLFYDGWAPDAFFWVGDRSTPDDKGIIIPNEKGNKDILTAYNGESIRLQLPNGLTVYDIRYLSIWCREYAIDFGNVLIPNDLWVPPLVGSS